MAEYYGVTRTSEYLAHYGVKGMRWGVRRAREKNDPKALERQYRKALKKAKKLNTKANIQRSQQEYKGRMADAATLGITGATVAGAGLGLRAAQKATNARAIGVMNGIPFDTETMHYATTPIGAALGGWGAYNLGKGLAAKYRTTAKGHARAAAKAQNFRSEMKKAFKGTKYSGLPGANGMNKAYTYEPVKRQLGNAAIDAVTYPGYSMNRKISREIPENKPRHSTKNGRPTSVKKRRG